MYLLISRNNPYLEEINKNPQSQTLQRDFDGMEIDIKNRFKGKDLKDQYNISNLSSNTFTDDSSTSNNTSIYSLNAKVSQISEEEKGVNVNKKDSIKYKNYIHLLNASASVLIIISAILSIIENENFHRYNKHRRKIGSIIINYIYNNPEKHSWNNMFSDSNVNLSDILESKAPSVPSIIANILFNNGTIDTNFKNEYILYGNNLTDISYKYTDDVTNYKSVDIQLEITSTEEHYRYGILIITLFGGLLLSIGAYLAYFREEKFIKESGIPFYKSIQFFIVSLKCIYLLLFQYPSLKSVTNYGQLDCIMTLPMSSLLSAFAIFRFFFVIYIINTFSIWDTTQSESILEKYNLNTNVIFTFKAYQKSNPFLTLFVLFFLSCICFSFNIRVFEMHYWETQSKVLQNWEYRWNALWCVFVTMTTVGYGDFFPKTHFGRILIIFSAFVGIYFISMMMIIMTQKSILTESEQRSYKLITRLKFRNELKDIYSKMIFHAFKMVKTKNEKKKKILDVKEYEIKYSYEKRSVISLIEENKILLEKIKSFYFIPTKEQLYDISERIDLDIKEIKSEIEILTKMNIVFSSYTDSQVNMIKYLKKSIQNTSLMLSLIEKKPNSFGKLCEYDKKELENEIKKIYKEHKDNGNILEKYLNVKGDLKLEKLFDDEKKILLDQNKNYSSGYDVIYSEELEKYNVTQQEYIDNFKDLFFENNEQNIKVINNNNLRNIKNIKNIKEMKKKIDETIMKRRNAMDVIDENNSNSETEHSNKNKK